MKLRTNPSVYWHQALGICQEFPGYNKLNRKELQVLAELMRCKHEGYKPILNSKTRGLIETKLDLSPQALRNNLSQLRAKGLLVDEEIPEKYLIKYLQPFQFEFYENKDNNL